LPIDALFGGVVEDVDLPEGEKELTYNRIAHDRPIIALPIRNRCSITRREPLSFARCGLRTTLAARKRRVVCGGVRTGAGRDDAGS
jgi:hypothetical protein